MISVLFVEVTFLHSQFTHEDHNVEFANLVFDTFKLLFDLGFGFLSGPLLLLYLLDVLNLFRLSRCRCREMVVDDSFKNIILLQPHAGQEFKEPVFITGRQSVVVISKVAN